MNRNIKRRIMELCRDWRDVSDLSQKLREIKINDADLKFGPRTFEFTPDADALDICIRENLFPEIEVWACPMSNEI
jgi:uncharacterized protein (DUF2461 family)